MTRPATTVPAGQDLARWRRLRTDEDGRVTAFVVIIVTAIHAARISSTLPYAFGGAIPAPAAEAASTHTTAEQATLGGLRSRWDR
jgi:hypothetical protein